MKPLTVLLGDLRPTDANRAVLELLRWLRREDRPARVIAGVDGPLHRDVARAADLFLVNEWRTRRLSPTLQKLGRHRAAEVARSVELRARLGRPGPVAYLADPAAAHLLGWLPGRTEVIGHLHRRAGDPFGEMDHERLRLLRSRVGHWVVGSQEAAAILERRLGVVPADTTHLHDLVPASELWARRLPGPIRARRDAYTRERLAERYGIPVDTPLVCARGRIDHLDVTDLFAQLCWTVADRHPELPAHWLWLGDGSTGRMVWPLHHDLRHAGLEDRVHVHPGRADPPPLECVAASMVQVFTNREPVDRDAELATAGVGTVAVGFDAPDRARSDVPPLAETAGWLDVEAVADQVARLLRDPGARSTLGEHPADEPASWDPAIGGPVLLDLLATAAPR